MKRWTAKRSQAVTRVAGVTGSTAVTVQSKSATGTRDAGCSKMGTMCACATGKCRCS